MYMFLFLVVIWIGLLGGSSSPSHVGTWKMPESGVRFAPHDTRRLDYHKCDAIKIETYQIWINGRRRSIVFGGGGGTFSVFSRLDKDER